MPLVAFTILSGSIPFVRLSIYRSDSIDVYIFASRYGRIMGEFRENKNLDKQWTISHRRAICAFYLWKGINAIIS